jgi:hypothetical protein
MCYFRPAAAFRFYGTPLAEAYIGLRALGRNLRALLSRPRRI